MQKITLCHASIRPFSLEDSAVVSNLIHRCLREVNIHDYGDDHISRMLSTFAVKNLSRWFEGADPYVLVDRDEIVATGTVRGCEIQTVFVLPNYHGKGYGKRLMVFLEQRILAKGFAEATLNSSLTAKNFYIALGYDLMGETLGGIGGQMLAMRKRL